MHRSLPSWMWKFNLLQHHESGFKWFLPIFANYVTRSGSILVRRRTFKKTQSRLCSPHYDKKLQRVDVFDFSTRTILPFHSVWSTARIAASASSSFSKDKKPNPRDSPDLYEERNFQQYITAATFLRLGICSSKKEIWRKEKLWKFSLMMKCWYRTKMQERKWITGLFCLPFCKVLAVLSLMMIQNLNCNICYLKKTWTIWEENNNYTEITSSGCNKLYGNPSSQFPHWCHYAGDNKRLELWNLRFNSWIVSVHVFIHQKGSQIKESYFIIFKAVLLLCTVARLEETILREENWLKTSSMRPSMILATCTIYLDK